jgi:hypothetical protein
MSNMAPKDTIGTVIFARPNCLRGTGSKDWFAGLFGSAGLLASIAEAKRELDATAAAKPTPAADLKNSLLLIVSFFISLFSEKFFINITCFPCFVHQG